MGPSKEALAYIAEQLGMAESEDGSLDKAIRELRFKQEGVQLKIKALRAALQDAGVAVSDEPRQITINGLAATPLPLREERSNPQEVGIRAAVRKVLLEEAPNGLRTRDVLKELTKRGFKFNGKVEPATRLSTELWRMAKAKQIEKRGAEYFATAGGSP
jgi:hypothetical protein